MSVEFEKLMWLFMAIVFTGLLLFIVGYESCRWWYRSEILRGQGSEMRRGAEVIGNRVETGR